jgi:hypothetical protein
MNTPRFTAESSLAKATMQYRSVGNFLQNRPMGAVIPQLAFLGYGGGSIFSGRSIRFCPPMCVDQGDHCLCPLLHDWY